MGPTEITIRGTRHRNAHQAIQHLHVSGDDRAVLVGRMVLSVVKSEADRLEVSGFPFAYLFDRDRSIITVPVNDD